MIAEMYVHKKMKTTKETSLETLKEVLPLLEAQEDYSATMLFMRPWPPMWRKRA